MTKSKSLCGGAVEPEAIEEFLVGRETGSRPTLDPDLLDVVPFATKRSTLEARGIGRAFVRADRRSVKWRERRAHPDRGFWTLPTELTLRDGVGKVSLCRSDTDHSKSCSPTFFNPWPAKKTHANAWHWLWLLQRQPAKWPKWEKNTAPAVEWKLSNDLTDWDMTFVGHSTVLLRIGPYHFLTDPVWALRASPFPFAGPRRVRAAGIPLDQLPKIDGVLLSHNHYDHMDMAALRWLHDRDQMPIYTGLGNGAYLPDDMNVVELDWWDTVPFAADPRLNITFTPAQHFSGRGFRDRNQSLWGGLSITGPGGHMFFAGDTGYAPHFKEISERLGKPRLALLPIGAYEPRKIMQTMHMNPSDAVKAHQDLQACHSVAIHHRTFQLTDEAMNQPLVDLAVALTEANEPSTSFLTPLEGETVAIP